MLSVTHKFLQQIGILKLARMGYWTVYPEVFAGDCCGKLDIVGAKDIFYPRKIETIGIEVKVSRADYFGKKQKALNTRFKNGFGGMGVNLPYFLVPKGMISIDELYAGWGLMYYDISRGIIKTIVPAPEHKVDNSFVLYEMAQVPVYKYHQVVTKLVVGYSWINASDIIVDLQKEIMV